MLRDNEENPSQFEPLMVGETSSLRADLLGISDRIARSVTFALLEAGVIHAESTRAPLLQSECYRYQAISVVGIQ